MFYVVGIICTYVTYYVTKNTLRRRLLNCNMSYMGTIHGNEYKHPMDATHARVGEGL